MKNREKFRDEIVEAIKEDNDENGKMCCFAKDNVIPRFVSEEDIEVSTCGGMDCHTCEKMFAFWLDEEYVEPPTDWSKVPVDTLVRVRYSVNGEWLLRYFKGIDTRGYCQPFETWADGATSVTAEGYTEHWEHCELAEDAAETE